MEQNLIGVDGEPAGEPSGVWRLRTGREGYEALFNPGRYLLTLVNDDGEERVELGFAGSRLLERLMQSPGEIVSREELMSFAWADRVVGQGSLNQQIYTLRQLLGDEKNRDIIQTLPRRGYLFNPEYRLSPPLAAVMAEPDSATTEPARPAVAQSAPVRRATRRMRRPAWIGGLAATLALGAVSLPAISSKKPLLSQELRSGLLHEVFVARDAARIERLMAESRELSAALARLNNKPLEVIHSGDGDYHKLWCRTPSGARWLMVHRSQLDQVDQGTLRKCLS